jgi:hypothetical protein
MDWAHQNKNAGFSCENGSDKRHGFSEVRTRMTRGRKILIWVGSVALVVLATLAVLAEVALHRVEPFLRARIVEGLEEHFHARVELDDFHVSLVHGVSAVGSGLRIWPPAPAAGSITPGATDGGAPLIRLAEFRFHAPLHYKRGNPIHITQLELSGLDIDVPPRKQFHPWEANKRAGNAMSAHGSQDTSAVKDAPPEVTAPPPPANPLSSQLMSSVKFIVDRIECSGARLVLENGNPDKLPLEFVIARLNMVDVTLDQPMQFDAELTNPRPKGTVYTTGKFGPWVVEDPGETAVSGDYSFKDADLSTFSGIAGILNSTGNFEGTLREITADGDTDTPDFRLTHFGNTMPLHAHFHARIDGTNGDTWLEPVDAMLGHSHFTAQGQVVRVSDKVQGTLRLRGRDILLHVNVDKARVEDFLHLASATPAQLLIGDVRVKAVLHIPPGNQNVLERLTLDGDFHLDQARFTSPQIQDRIEELSLHGQGRGKEVKTTDPATIQSQMEGTFAMAAGTIKLPALSYKVAGADIDLKGAYVLEGGALDFKGTAKLQATVSEIVGGWKGMLLKPADRLFKKDGAGTEVPIYINGTREAPKFGLDFEKFKTTSPESPGKK